MKLTTIALGLSLLSSAATAENFQKQVDLDYSTSDNYDVFSLNGTYYFDRVSTQNTAWAEAAFMGKNSNINAAYTNFDGNGDGLNLGGEVFVDKFYGALKLTYVDFDVVGSDTVISGEFGYLFAENWLVAITAQDEDFSDSLGVRTKYVAKLAGGQFINLEASYDDASKDFIASGDYYWTAQSSVGVILSDTEGFDIGLQAQHFFTPSVALRVAYTIVSGDDVASVGISGRF